VSGHGAESGWAAQYTEKIEDKTVSGPIAIRLQALQEPESVVFNTGYAPQGASLSLNVFEHNRKAASWTSHGLVDISELLLSLGGSHNFSENRRTWADGVQWARKLYTSS
jgi:hypothetical protein